MRNVLRVIFLILLFAVLTVLTQIGGLVMLLALLLYRLAGVRRLGYQILAFLTLYLIVSWLIVPPLAGHFGRERVLSSDRIRPANRLTNLLNRQYVRPELNRLLTSAAERLPEDFPPMYYLDAGFPFINGFPLLPHLSHDDGRKIDLAFLYEDTAGALSKRIPTLSGYGFFTAPRARENDQIAICVNKGYWQYDLTKYVTLGTIHPALKFSESANRTLMRALLAEPLTGKIFIEPHLKQRLALKDGRIRYHGCQAVRHDDHIHLQL